MISRHSHMHLRMFRLNFQRLIRGFLLLNINKAIY
nr:MAG TPA_asm: hypothetical protein [Bacteriophage sp.]